MQKNLSNTYSDKTDNQLVSMVKSENDSRAFEEICKRYENVFYKICQKYLSTLSSSGINLQDIFDEKTFIIYHCVKTFDENRKAKLSTWIGNYARYLCLNAINSRRFILPSIDNEEAQQMESLQRYVVPLEDPEEDYKSAIQIIDKIKDPRIKEVFRYRYMDNKKMIWSKIAEKLKISTQTALNLHNKGIKILKKEICPKKV